MCTYTRDSSSNIFVETPDEVSFHEGLGISVLGWLITCIIGTIPYFLWGGEFSFANAIFESVSGFTTTGSTILNDIEVLPKGILFWRASTHFIGGAGIILFVLLILPDKRGIQSSIYHSEVSGLSMMNFKTKTKEIGNIIVIVYCSLVLLETVLLKLLGMEWFDAICHSFATVATGGFPQKI
jgi:trk system potassium uptake protein TrkH